MGKKIQLIDIRNIKSLNNINNEFVSIILNLDPSTYELETIIKTLIDKGCKHFVSGGKYADEIHDLADTIHLEMFYPSYKIPDSEHIMTSAPKSINEAIFYGLNLTNFDKYEFHDFIIIYDSDNLSESDLEIKIKKENIEY